MITPITLWTGGGVLQHLGVGVGQVAEGRHHHRDARSALVLRRHHEERHAIDIVVLAELQGVGAVAQIGWDVQTQRLLPATVIAAVFMKPQRTVLLK